jgi:hypothetical protein
MRPNGMAMALQRFGDRYIDRLLQEMEKWSHGNQIETRKDLKNNETNHQ